MRWAFSAIAVAVLLAACGSAQSGSRGTGIQGTVVAGPTCPVERINSPCPAHPLAATVIVRNSQGGEVARIGTGSDGRFRLDLAAGTYTLIGQPIGTSGLPRPLPTSVTVRPGAYTNVTVEYDSGIR